MPRLLFTSLLILLSSYSFSQSNYFQQQVDYKIEVSLDDENHILRGFESMRYTNNSKDTLKSIFMHLWANAYKNDKTSFTQQEVENGKTDFYFSKQVDRGFIDSLSFKVNNEVANISNYNNLEDVIIIELIEPLLPNQSIEITTPFRVVIPYSFSRLGHIDQTYQISQWYPKPAVYDKQGWHPMPYLDQGEFYSEYGNYQVSITLPASYVVAATGDLQEESEKLFIESKIKAKDSSFRKIDSTVLRSAELKTITFKQSNVHDFAWFADSELRIEKTEAKLRSGKKVQCYSYYKPSNYRQYKGSSETIARTISYLSEHVGEYPYQHASIVDAPLMAGSGMEYPNIAVIGSVGSKSTLQTVIIHEVGHNWFYGILGSNERAHPWMDESINSFYENEIKKDVQAAENMTGIERKANSLEQKLNGAFLYHITAKKNTDQAIDLPAVEFTNSNYGGMVYQKGAMMFDYLSTYLGQQNFEKAMKRYFTEWKFKHPYPDDFRNIMQAESGKDLNWFFDEGFNSTTKIDFALMSVSGEGTNANVEAKSRTSFKGPVPIMACIKDSVVQTKWIEYPYTNPAAFTNLPEGITSYKIDAKQVLPEIKISNNNYRKYALFHRLQPALKLGTGIGISTKNELYVLPAIGYNYYDKLMFGAAIHNLEVPNNAFQFALAPMYSIGSKSPVGSGFISYSIFPKTSIQQITFGLQGRTYHHDESSLNISKSIYLRHIKVMPSITIDFKKKYARSPVSNQLQLRYYYISNQVFQYTLSQTDSLYRPSIYDDLVSHLGSINFAHKHTRRFNPYSYNISAIGNSNFLKASLEANLKIDYFKKGKAFYVRFFAGKFFDLKTNNNVFAIRNQYLNTNYTANNDFMYDQVYLARNEQSGFLSKQVSMREGGFKVQTNLLANPIGQNDNWLTAINLRTDLPVKLPIKIQLFLDAGTYANAKKLNGSGNPTVFDGGVEVHLFKELLIIYAPLIMSQDFKDYTKSTYSKNRFLNTMSFSLNLDKINWTKTQNVISLLN